MIHAEMTSVVTIADADLVSRTLAGDRDAFTVIVSRYQTLICSLAYSATGSLGHSEDLAQETFITAWKHLGHLREPGKLRAWLCGLARNRINNYLRREGRKPMASAEPIEAVGECAAPEPPPAEIAMSQEEQALLWRMLERIPQIYREPLILFYREQQSVETVAAALELSEDAVKQRLSRGRKLLQERMVAFVEGALERTNPGQAFTVAVVAALPVFAGSASAATLGSAAAKTSVAGKAAASLGIAGAILGPIVGLLGGVLGTKMSIANTQSPRERQFMVRLAWSVWILAIGFGLGLFAYGALFFRSGSLTHPVLVTAGFIGFTLLYCLALLGLIIWGNRTQRRIKLEEEAKSPGATPVKQRPFRTEPFEYRSRLSFLGLPLVHVRMECKQDGKALPAKGWIAIGNVAYGGLFAFAGFAVAPISFGGFALGLLAIGGGAVGLFSFAGMAIGIWALGGAAIGYAASGGGAAAWLAATGGCAIARDFALGGLGGAAHFNDQAARAFVAQDFFFRHVASLMQQAMFLVWLPLGLVLWQMLRVRKQQT